MNPPFENFVLLLGTRSPRRRQLIEGMDIPFRTVEIAFEEEKYPEKEVVALAKAKNLSYTTPLRNHEILLTADTLVISDDEILGKPRNENEAIRMLERLSGKTHRVETGVCLRSAKEMRCFKEQTLIRFKRFSDEEIRYYVKHYRPLDKAGAYGIQEWLGLIGVEKIEGDYYNVMGLPTAKLWDALLRMIKK